MGKYQRGVLGSFQGRVGTVVGTTWKGMEIMKIKRRTGMSNPTQKQLEQQARFSFMIKFVRTLSGLFDLSFNDADGKITGINNAFRYNYKSALAGTYPSFSLNYSKVLVSKGVLLNAGSPTATAAGGGIVKFDWADNSGLAMANADDKCILVVHCPALNQSVYKTGGTVRSTGTDSLNVNIFTGRTVETWLGFITTEGKEVATSLYAGQVVVS